MVAAAWGPAASVQAGKGAGVQARSVLGRG